ncbi:hypothetical protein AB0I66_42365 [Streptomyces sp. NPDC050439]|uniref:hypothetical protein n=1 Tax=unclassified Streptomyces TaxID=2593676 RepID=UPI0034164645
MKGKTAATKRGPYLRPHTVNARVHLWFNKPGLQSDGRPVTSQGFRAGGATVLGLNGATDKELEEAGRWKKGSRIPLERYLRPAQTERNDPVAKIPVHRAR